MNKKELFAKAVKQSISAFNNVPEETRIGLANAGKIRALFATLDVNSRPERLTKFSDEMSKIFGYEIGPLVVSDVKRDVQPFLIAKATANPNGHAYNSNWFFIRGATVRTPYLLDPEASACGEALNQVCEPDNWVTPEETELDSVIENAWKCYTDKPDSSFASWIDQYFGPLSFLITEGEA